MGDQINALKFGQRLSRPHQRSIFRQMKILLLAPHPFFEERGTPIAVNLLLRLFDAQGHIVDLLTFHIGQSVSHDNLTVFRTPRIWFIKHIRPGLSLKKIVCDVLMLFKVFWLVRRRRPDVIHAVEESVFLAVLIKVFLGIPYVYDMDSSMVSQIKESHRFLGVLQPFFRLMEGLAINHAIAVLPVCPALVDIVKQHNKPRHVVLMTDISLLDPHAKPAPLKLREELAVQGTVFMYIGNLNPIRASIYCLKRLRLCIQKSRVPASSSWAARLNGLMPMWKKRVIWASMNMCILSGLSPCRSWAHYSTKPTSWCRHAAQAKIRP